MNKLLSGLMATTLAASFAIASVVPLNAAPVYVPKSEQVQTDVQQVNHTRRHWRISSSVALNAALTANGDGRHGGTSIGTATMTTATTTNAAMASAIIPVATGAAMTASPCSSASRG